ncbi:hypothetical protein [Paenibacillus lactis]
MADPEIELAKNFVLTASKKELLLLLNSLSNEAKHEQLIFAIQKLIVVR